MVPQRPRDGSRVVVLSGSGLSVASAIPPWRDAAGGWDGHRIEDVATVEAWWRNREQVRKFYDARRLNCVHVYPNLAHEALARLQHRWGARRVVLATTTLDGLLIKAGAADVWEIFGSLWSIQCEEDEEHPHLQIAGPQNRDRKCAMCGAIMRPDVVWANEPPRFIARLEAAARECELMLCVGLADLGDPVAPLLATAKAAGATLVEVNTTPSGNPAFDQVITQPAEDVLPELVATWLGEVPAP